MARAARYSRGARHLLVLVMLWLLVLTQEYGPNAIAAAPGSVVINEVAWMGTQASSSDEWIELLNNIEQAIDMTGWGIFEVSASGVETLIEPLTGVIQPKALYLIERTDENTVSDIPADQAPSSWGGSGLSNSGEHLILKDNAGIVIDEVNAIGGWFAGNASPSFRTMERIDPLQSGSNPENWATNNGITRNGLDAGGNPINGTPKAPNSTTIVKINAPPIAKAGPDLTTEEGTSIILNGSESSDPDGDALTCTWDPGDGSGTLAGCVVSHAYADIGVFTATLTVDDGNGGIGVDTLTVTVRAPPSKGDANGNGAIDLHDAILCAEIALELRTPTNREEATCDVAAPFGVIDGRDVVRIAEKLP